MPVTKPAHESQDTSKRVRKTDGSGTIYRRKDPETGEETGPYWVKIHVDGRPVYESTGTTSYTDAIKHRDRMIARKSRGEISGGPPDRVTIGELLDDLLNNSTVKPETLYIWRKVIDANVRPFFGKIKATRLTTDKMEDYRRLRRKGKRSETTVNRELSLVRMAFNAARKRTPPKVLNLPYFPMKPETNIRQGYLEDAQYVKLRDELPAELRPLFIVAHATGVRKGELLKVRWEQVDWQAEEIVLRRGETKNKVARVLPFLTDDMATYLKAAKEHRDANYPQSPWVFNRNGEQIKDFKRAWALACARAGVPDLHFHDLRRTSVRNMRRAGIPQVIRMRISGHKTDSMERRYSIVDMEDFAAAKAAMRGRKADS